VKRQLRCRRQWSRSGQSSAADQVVVEQQHTSRSMSILIPAGELGLCSEYVLTGRAVGGMNIEFDSLLRQSTQQSDPLIADPLPFAGELQTVEANDSAGLCRTSAENEVRFQHPTRTTEGAASR
jgi:hypothetical protein